MNLRRFSKVLLGLAAGAVVAVGTVSCSDDKSNTNFTIYSSAQSISPLIVPRAPAGSPTSLTLQIYGLYVSPNADCTDAVQILDNGNTPVAVNVYAANTLFSGVVTSGTYQCIGLEMSDVIAYRVDSVAVAAFPAECTSPTTDFVSDLYRDGESDDGNWKDHEGNPIDATGSSGTPSSDRIFTFATTDTAAAAAGALGLDPNQLIDLNGALVVPGSVTFFADFNNGIEANGGHCALEEGGFGFR